MEQIHSTTSKRKWKQLTEKDRYHLEAYFNAGMRTQEIAERMGYSKRTIGIGFNRAAETGEQEHQDLWRSPKIMGLPSGCGATAS